MRKNSPAKEAHGRCPDGDGHLPKITTYTCVFVMGVCLCVFVCLCMAVARSWCVTCSNLCIAYQNTGQVDKALTLLKRVLQRRKQLFGEPHPKVANTLCTLSSLCVCHLCAKRHAEVLSHACCYSLLLLACDRHTDAGGAACAAVCGGCGGHTWPA